MHDLIGGLCAYAVAGAATACLLTWNARRLRRTDLAWHIKNPGTLESDVMVGGCAGAVWPVVVAFLLLAAVAEWADGPKKPEGGP